ncbi:MAG: GNAT family N-acetyltransferase [Terriglobia bacterium]
MTPEIIDIRQFTAQAFETLLDAESRAWDSALHWDFAGSKRLISSCLDEKRLSGYALVNNGIIKGYSFFFYEGEKGLIGSLFVAPNGELLDPALVLLKHVIETLVATPGLRRVETQLPHYSMEQLEPSFRAHGFSSFLRRFMSLPISARWSAAKGYAESTGPASRPQPANLGGFQFMPWERKHDRSACEVILNAYRGHVDGQINDQYGSLAGTSHLVENIMTQRGCGDIIPDASLVALHRPTQKLAGVLAVSSVRGRTAHVPQIAVAREFQNMNLGRRLMEMSFQQAARHGYEEITLTVTDLNAGAVRFYERLGFQTLRTFGAFVWDAR